MPCDIIGHEHNWPEEGELIIEKCEKYCGYCEEQYAEHPWKFAWFLRRHVRTVHCRHDTDYPDVTVSDSWTGAPPKRPRLPPRTTRRKRRNTVDGTYAGIKKETSSPTPAKRTRAKSAAGASKKKSATPKKAKAKASATSSKKGAATPGQGITKAMKNTKLGLADAAAKEEQEGAESIESMMKSFIEAVEDLAQQGLEAGIPSHELSMIFMEQAAGIDEQEA